MRAGRTHSCCVCCNIELQEEGGATGLSLLPQQGINIHSWWNNSIKWGVRVPIWACTGCHATHRGKQRCKGTHTLTNTMKGRGMYCILYSQTQAILHFQPEWCITIQRKTQFPHSHIRDTDTQTYHTFHQSENQEALRLDKRGALHQPTQNAKCINTFIHWQQGNTEGERVKEKHQPHKAFCVSCVVYKQWSEIQKGKE